VAAVRAKVVSNYFTIISGKQFANTRLTLSMLEWSATVLDSGSMLLIYADIIIIFYPLRYVPEGV